MKIDVLKRNKRNKLRLKNINKTTTVLLPQVEDDIVHIAT